MKSFKTLIIITTLAISISSCKKEENNSVNTNPTEVDNSLHFSFKTSDWERNVDCSHLYLFGQLRNDSTKSATIPSASTNATFVFDYPADSSVMVLSNNLKKYSILDYATYNHTPFSLALKLPLQFGSTQRLLSNAGLSNNEYCQIIEIKYLKSTPHAVQFSVKGIYSMNARILNDTTGIIKPITGTFNWKVNTSRR